MPPRCSTCGGSPEWQKPGLARHFGWQGLLYDWIYDAMTPAERAQFGELLGEWVATWWHTERVQIERERWWYNQDWGPAHLDTPNHRVALLAKLLIDLAVAGQCRTFRGLPCSDESRRLLRRIPPRRSARARRDGRRLVRIERARLLWPHPDRSTRLPGRAGRDTDFDPFAAQPAPRLRPRVYPGLHLFADAAQSASWRISATPRARVRSSSRARRRSSRGIFATASRAG